MPFATVTFDRNDEPADWNQIDIFGLQEVVMAALDRHFAGYDQAADALEEYKRVQAEINADPNMSMFGIGEAVRAGLAAHPKALEWSAFEKEAAAEIAPFCFSLRFTG